MRRFGRGHAGNGAASEGIGDEPLDEEALALRARVDPAAFVPLYHRYFPEMTTFAARRLSNRTDVEDLAAEIMRKAFEKRAAFRGGSYRAWIYTIAINTLRDHFRRAAPPGELPFALPDESPGPEELALRAAADAEVRAALIRLPEDVQLVVDLRAQGYSCGAVAETLGRDADWVRLTHHRTMERLARELGIARKEGRRG
jgi:RNA polymerase sigma-70 factor, ECF subfamily